VRLLATVSNDSPEAQPPGNVTRSARGLRRRGSPTPWMTTMLLASLRMASVWHPAGARPNRVVDFKRGSARFSRPYLGRPLKQVMRKGWPSRRWRSASWSRAPRVFPLEGFRGRARSSRPLSFKKSAAFAFARTRNRFGTARISRGSSKAKSRGSQTGLYDRDID